MNEVIGLIGDTHPSKRERPRQKEINALQAEIDRLSVKIRNWRIVAGVQLVGILVLIILVAK